MFSFRGLLVVGEYRNENLYNSCDDRGTGGARSRPDGARQGWWQARAKKRRANSRRTAAEEERRKRIQGLAQENSRSDGQERPVGKHALSNPRRPRVSFGRLSWRPRHFSKTASPRSFLGRGSLHGLNFINAA